MYWSPPRVAACICHNVEQQQISAQANVYFVLWICISIFHIWAQFYFTPDADAGSNEARQWPSRNPRTGEVIQIKASNVPSFKAGKALKDAVNWVAVV